MEELCMAMPMAAIFASFSLMHTWKNVVHRIKNRRQR